MLESQVCKSVCMHVCAHANIHDKVEQTKVQLHLINTFKCKTCPHLKSNQLDEC